MSISNKSLLSNTIYGQDIIFTNTLTSSLLKSDTNEILLDAHGNGFAKIDPTDTLKVNNIVPASGSSVTITGLVATYPIVMPDNIQVNTINEKTLNGQLLLQTTGTNNVGIENFTFKDDLLSNVNDLTISTSGTTKNINITPTGNINLNGTTKVDTINENTLNGQLTIQTTGTNSVNIKSGGDHVDIQENVHIYDKTYNNKFIDLFYDGLTDSGSILMYDGNHSMNLCGGSTLLNGAYINLATGTGTKDVYFGCDHIYFKNNASTAYYGKFDSAGLSVNTINEYTTNGNIELKINGSGKIVGTGNLSVSTLAGAGRIPFQNSTDTYLTNSSNFTYDGTTLIEGNVNINGSTGIMSTTAGDLGLSSFTGNINLSGTVKLDAINEKTTDGMLIIQTTGTNNVKIENTEFKVESAQFEPRVSNVDITEYKQTNGIWLLDIKIGNERKEVSVFTTSDEVLVLHGSFERI